ncbi:hypothetical protein [Marinilactibacillus psychrotolerans]|uniref:hypothetical protein n=1 Tax=Marinilactibacillus psychrotolerans TaxID=191770 RepID=UPI0039B03DC3
MKSKLFLLSLTSLFLIGCGTNNEADNHKSKLEDLGLSSQQSEYFYDYSTATKVIFLNMESINNTIEDTDYVVNNDEYNIIKDNIENSQIAYEKMNPKNFEKFNDYFVEDGTTSGNPLQIIDFMESYHREYSLVEADMMRSMFYGYAEKALVSNKIPNENKKEILDWYVDYNQYTGLIKESHEYRSRSN